MEEQQQQLWHDCFEDALRSAAEAVGPKTIGAELWPEKPIQQAAQLLFHCLNPERSEKLSAGQIALIIRRGRDAGCHTPMSYLAQDAGYEQPRPADPETEKERLQREFVEAQQHMSSLVQRMEKING